MCHVMLLLPALALPLFWLAPLSIAVPAYVAIVILSGGIYFLAVRAMQRPVQTGMEALLHSRGEVLSKADRLFRVRVHSEIWNAVSEDALRPGDRVEVVAIDELRLRVRRIGETGAGLARGIICEKSCCWRGEDHGMFRPYLMRMVEVITLADRRGKRNATSALMTCGDSVYSAMRHGMFRRTPDQRREYHLRVRNRP